MILTTLATHSLTVSLQETGVPVPSDSDNKPHQNHVEIAQAIALSLDIEKVSRVPIPPDKMQIIWDGLVTISNDFIASRYVQLEEKKTQEEKSIAFICEQIRSHTQFIRNWGYFKKVITVLHDLYGKLNPIYETVVGIKATNIIDIFHWMTSQAEKRHQEFYKKMAYCNSGKTKRGIVERYYESFDMEGDVGDMMNFIKENKIPRQGIISIMLTHSDFRRIGDLMFTSLEIAEEFELEESNVVKLMNLLSLSFGDLKNKKFEYLFLDNPVCKKPLIKLMDGVYFCAMPQLFFSFSLPILDSLLKENKRNAEKLSKRKSVYLEDRIAALFKESFPNSIIIKGHKWKIGTVTYETDLIVKYDNQLIIVEAKSGSITDIALRGAVKRIKKHLKEIIFDPAIQAKRLENLIASINSGGIGEEDYNLILPFELSEVQSITSMAVTLEDFATIQTNTETLPTKELYGEKLPSIPTMLHSDLEVVFDILQYPSERMHYLKRRSEILKTVKYTGDELDLLGLYISNGFCLNQFEDAKTQLIISDMSSPIDEYYTAVDHGFEKKKPKRKNTKWFQDMINSLEERQPKGFSQIIFNLLCVHYEDQIKLGKETQRILKKLKTQNGFQKNQVDRILYTPPEPSEVGVAIVYSFTEEMPERHEKLKETASQFFDQSDIDFCTVILRDVEEQRYPYSTLAIYFR